MALRGRIPRLRATEEGQDPVDASEGPSWIELLDARARAKHLQEQPAAPPADPGAGAEEAGPGRLVRPYALTGGRTRSKGVDLPLETLVSATDEGRRRPGQGREQARILNLCGERPLSIAEISAHLHMPLGIARVLVSDLAEEGAVEVHGGASVTAPTDLKLLERVLNGLRAL